MIVQPPRVSCLTISSLSFLVGCNFDACFECEMLQCLFVWLRNTKFRVLTDDVMTKIETFVTSIDPPVIRSFIDQVKSIISLNLKWKLTSLSFQQCCSFTTFTGYGFLGGQNQDLNGDDNNNLKLSTSAI